MERKISFFLRNNVHVLLSFSSPTPPPLQRLPSALPIKCKKIVPSTRCRWNCSSEPRRPRRPRLPWNTKRGERGAAAVAQAGASSHTHSHSHTAATAAAAAAEQHQAVTLLVMCVFEAPVSHSGSQRACLCDWGRQSVQAGNTPGQIWRFLFH